MLHLCQSSCANSMLQPAPPLQKHKPPCPWPRAFGATLRGFHDTPPQTSTISAPPPAPRPPTRSTCCGSRPVLHPHHPLTNHYERIRVVAHPLKHPALGRELHFHQLRFVGVDGMRGWMMRGWMMRGWVGGSFLSGDCLQMTRKPACKELLRS